MSGRQPAPDVVEIEQAKRNAAVAKARMQTTVGALKQRLNPRTIAADAVENVKEKTNRAGDMARARPGAASAVASVAALILFRKPVGKLAKRLFSRTAREERRNRKDAKRIELDLRRAEKAKRRDAKLRERELRKEAKAKAKGGHGEDGLIRAGAPEDLISLPAGHPAAVPAKQE